MSDKGLEKINLLYKPEYSHYYAFFDETEFPEQNIIVTLMVITNSRQILTSKFNDIKIKAIKQFPDILKGNILHFTDILEKGYGEFLKWALGELNKLDLVIIFNFVDVNDLKKSGLNNYQILSHKMTNFAPEFIKIWESNLKKENITFIFDEGFIPDNKIRKYFYVVLEYDKSHSQATFIPEVPNFYKKIKDDIYKCVDFMVFPTEKSLLYMENGIQAADLIAGALRQNFKGNKEFIDIIKSKFLQEGNSGRLKNNLNWSL